MGRRKETTEFLKECIADAMIKLMRKQSLEKITIQEITDEAGVGRVTYFRYYSSKQEVLVYKLSLLWEKWEKNHPFPIERGDHERALWFFSFCYSIRSTLKILYKNEQQHVVLESYLNYTKPMLDDEDFKPSGIYYRSFMSYGMLGIVTEWVNRNFKETPEELAQFLVK